MISLLSKFVLIFFLIVKNVNSQEPSKDILGPSACDLYNMNKLACGTPDVPIESLPKECSSFLYEYFKVNNTDLIDEGELYGTIPGYLDALIKTNTTVLVYYYHATQMQWCAAVSADTTKQTEEMDELKTLLDKHPGVKGIVLAFLLDMVTDVSAADCPDYSHKLKTYIDLMHTSFPNMSIGIVISVKRASDWYDNPIIASLEYEVLDPSVDFYLVNFRDLNICSDDFIATGSYPLSGTDNSVEAMKKFLDDKHVPSPKVHYVFTAYGKTKDETRSCDANAISFCKNVPDAKSAMCVDTLQTLFDKGAFAKKNGAGFVVNTIDSDDFDSSCACGQPFPAFHALLCGYNGEPAPAPCALFDRT